MLPRGFIHGIFDGPFCGQNTEHYLEKKFSSIWMLMCRQEESIKNQKVKTKIRGANMKRKMV